MRRTGMQKLETVSLICLTLTAVIVSAGLYVNGLVNSGLIDGQRRNEQRYLQDYVENHGRDSRQEKILAESYWLRYRDVRLNGYWGENGPLGIWGARDHFEQHGRKEGRIFRPIPEIPDKEAEKKLAESYWQRYHDVEKSPIWGRKSDLGTAGPRDHYQAIGRFQGKIWGLEKN